MYCSTCHKIVDAKGAARTVNPWWIVLPFPVVFAFMFLMEGLILQAFAFACMSAAIIIPGPPWRYICPACGLRLSKNNDPSYCSRCNHENPRAAKFCGKCGRELT